MSDVPSASESRSLAELRRGIARWLLRNAIIVALAAACLFLTSRDMSWTFAWVYLEILLSSKVAMGLLLGRSNPELLVERGRAPSDAKSWDRLLAAAMVLWGPALGWILAGLDRRYAWSGSLPPVLQALGLLVTSFGVLQTLWAMVCNRFFLGFVRVAREQGHRVATEGPYRLVRHPGYLGAIVYQLATPLALNSLWTFVPATATVVATIARTALEDRTLLEELEGYVDYAKDMPYRLLPGVW